MKWTLKYDISGARELARKFPAAVRSVTVGVMQIIVMRLEGEVVQRTPRGVGGAAGLAGSIFGEVEAYGRQVTGIVGTPLEYGQVVELGRRPGQRRPPTAALIPWVRSILGVDPRRLEQVAWAVGTKIARKGTKGAFMFKRAWRATEGWAATMIKTIPARVKRKVNK